jgi:cell division septation protein DedD
MSHRMMITAVFGLSLAAWSCTSNERTSLSSEASVSSIEHNAKEAEHAEETLKDTTDTGDGPTASHGGKTDKKGHKTAAKDKTEKTSKKKSHKVATDEHETGHETAHNTTTKKRSPASEKEIVYIVQVGAFRVKENAEKLQARLKGEGFPVLMHSLNHSKNGLMHLVRFEPTPTRSEADKWLAQVKTKAEIDAVVLAQPVDE